MENFELKEGMIFNNPWEAGDYINCDWAKKPDTIYKALAHYCEFHKDKSLKIYIDRVFDDPIPFLRKGFVHKIGEIIETRYGSYKILNMYLKKRYDCQKSKERLYLCKCLIDGNEFEYNASQIAKGANCPVCRNRGFKPNHSLFDERPDLHIYIKNIDDAKKYAPNSGKRITCKCPDCGVEKDLIIEELTKFGFSCTECGDGNSYPNKFVNEFLNQLNVDHYSEKTFDWCGNKRYDQYLPDHRIIIENQGQQHYLEDVNGQFPGTSLKMQQLNDGNKYNLAKSHGLDVIYIDCSQSTKDWIKNSILSSTLPSILNFSEEDIDWEKCNTVACSSIVHKVWEMWNNDIPVSKIAESVQVCKSTIRSYINKGIDSGKCKPYFGVDEDTKNRRYDNSSYTNGLMNPIYCKTDDVYFASRFDCEDYYVDLFPKIGSALLYKNINSKKPYKGKEFIYITKEDFNNLYFQNKENVIGKPFNI